MSMTGCPCAALKDLGDQLRAERAKREAAESALADIATITDKYARITWRDLPNKSSDCAEGMNTVASLIEIIIEGRSA